MDSPPASPPYHLLVEHSTIRREGGSAHTSLLGVRIVWGDLTITGRTGEIDEKDGALIRLSVAGDVTLTRGPDVLKGASVTFDGATAAFSASDVSLIAPPLTARGKMLRSTADGTLALDDVALGFRTGEITVRARQARFRPDGKLLLDDAVVRIFGLRIVRLKSLRGSLNGGGGSHQQFSLPLDFRSSAISGQVLGVQIPVALHGLDGTASLDQTSRRGIQYGVSLTRPLASGRPTPDWQAIPFGRDPSLPPLASLTKARSVERETLTLADDLFTLASPVRPALWSETVRAEAFLRYQQRREISGRRVGPLLLSREPEVGGFVRYPLSPARFPLTAGALKTVRWIATGRLEVGRYTETRIAEGGAKVSRARRGLTVGLESSPLKVGRDLLAAMSLSQADLRYESSEHYRLSEAAAGLEWHPSPYAAIGAAVIDRAERGVSPLLYDRADSPSEGQIRARLPLPGTRLAVGALRRWDLRQRHTFDTEYALAVRGDGLVPRFTYRTLNRQFGVTFSLPAFQGR